MALRLVDQDVLGHYGALLLRVEGFRGLGF